MFRARTNISRWKKRENTYRLTLTAVITLLCLQFVSCHIDEPREVCNHNVQLRYRYFREISDTHDLIGSYVHSMDEYIFDEEGILYGAGRLENNSCGTRYESRSVLPPGRYAVVVLGNVAQASHVTEFVPGITKFSDMLFYLENPDSGTKQDGAFGDEPVTHSDSEKLYYGYGTFTVREKGISRVNIDMFHSHCVLSITVGWKSNPPSGLDDLYMIYREIPGAYAFTPRFVIADRTWHEYHPDWDDYPSVQSAAASKCYAPVCLDCNVKTAFRKDVNINVDRKINTRFITYRYTNESPLLISLYSGEGQVMKEIDLQRFFQEMDVDLNRNYRQEFDLLFEIDGDKVTVGFLNVSDWEEGGVIGT